MRSRWFLPGLAVRAVGWGLWISVLAGGAAGTVIFPVYGTIFGILIGGVVGIVPTVVGTIVVVVLARRHQPLVDPDGLYADLRRAFGWLHRTLVALGVGALGSYVVVLWRDQADFEGSLQAAVWLFLWIGVGPCVTATWVTARLLRRAAASLTLAAIRSGWSSTTGQTGARGPSGHQLHDAGVESRLSFGHQDGCSAMTAGPG